MQTIPAHADDHPNLDAICEALRSQRTPPDATWKQRRFAMEALQVQLAIADGIAVEPVDANGVPAAWIGHASSDDSPTEDVDPGVALYLHGGGYALGSIKTHRELMSRLAKHTNTRLLGVDYRLAPEHPYPAAVEDAVTSYRWLLAQGIDPARLAIAGDSAGGGLTLATLLRMRDGGDPLPSAAVLLSPWVDLTASGDSIDGKADDDPMVSREGLETMASAYARGRLDEPEVSPLFADLSDLPPILIQVGTAEVLLDDSVRLAEHIEQAGGQAKLEVWDRMIHVFHAFPQLPEADQAIERIAEYLNQHLS